MSKEQFETNTDCGFEQQSNPTNLTPRKRGEKSSSLLRTETLVKIAMLGAIAFLLYYLRFLSFPILPIIPFIRLEFSNIPALIGGFLMGPVAAIAIEVIRVGLFSMTGSNTMYVGEMSSLIIGISFVLPSVLIYRRMRTFKGAVIALLTGVLIGSFVAVLSNALIIFPLYREVVLGPAAFDNVVLRNGQYTIWHIMIVGILPFNLIALTANALLAMYLYKKLAVLFAGIDRSINKSKQLETQTKISLPRLTFVNILVGLSFVLILAFPMFNPRIDGAAVESHEGFTFGDVIMNYPIFLLVLVIPIAIIVLNMLNVIKDNKRLDIINIVLLSVQIILFAFVFPLFGGLVSEQIRVEGERVTVEYTGGIVASGGLLAITSLALAIVSVIYIIINGKGEQLKESASENSESVNSSNSNNLLE
ncbi:MAG: ECF transporter S component [Firmicutes bacterium]|nr:ECF transporter S component [Bacillota bacterium]